MDNELITIAFLNKNADVDTFAEATGVSDERFIEILQQYGDDLSNDPIESMLKLLPTLTPAEVTRVVATCMKATYAYGVKAGAFKYRNGDIK